MTMAMGKKRDKKGFPWEERDIYSPVDRGMARVRPILLGVDSSQLQK